MFKCNVVVVVVVVVVVPTFDVNAIKMLPFSKFSFVSSTSSEL